MKITLDPNKLPERDPVSLAVVGISFLLLIVWFVWSLLFPPVLRVSPALRVEPIPRNFGVVERFGPSRPGRPGAPVPYPFERGTHPPVRSPEERAAP